MCKFPYSQTHLAQHFYDANFYIEAKEQNDCGGRSASDYRAKQILVDPSVFIFITPIKGTPPEKSRLHI